MKKCKYFKAGFIIDKALEIFPIANILVGVKMGLASFFFCSLPTLTPKYPRLKFNLRKFISIFFSICILSFTTNASEKKTVDSLLHVLDVVINQKNIYTYAKLGRIDSLNYCLRTANNNNDRYLVYHALFKEYLNYNLDSALSIANKRLDVSKKLNNKRRINKSQMNVAEVWAFAGMYREALNIMDNIQSNTLDEDQYTYYYHLYFTVYDFLSKFTFKQIDRVSYTHLMSQYKDSLLLLIDPKSAGYYFLHSEKLMEQGNYLQALRYIDNAYEEFGEKAIEKNPIFDYTIATLYHHKGDVELEKKYLTIASIEDIRSATREYTALQKLAMILLFEGDIKRANTYIKCALEDAIACKTNFRTLETAEMFPVIIAAYEQKMEKENRQLYFTLLIITILSILLALSIFLIYKQLIKIRNKEKSIVEINKELEKINDYLNSLNKDLIESICVKEEYIGYVFNLCSTYITKLNKFRKEININVKLNQTDKVLQMTSPYKFIPNELKEFFYTFDSVFMKLYPNFIDEFNNLLIEEEQIIPKSDEILTPELRIFALIRLGITDSAKIAKFLNFSPQTVYNYRVKVRNKSVLPKDEFMQAIQKIGLSRP
ncbi:MAG: DUF6377 domain-containing protein [Pigmentiphaga sp.]|nr:DUF6377 domain-containing protein [Pigmentiphaga sp.]